MRPLREHDVDVPRLARCCGARRSAGITTWPWEFLTSSTMDPLNEAPALVVRVEIVSLTATSMNVPAAAVRVAGAAGAAGVPAGLGFGAGGRDFGGDVGVGVAVG